MKLNQLLIASAIVSTFLASSAALAFSHPKVSDISEGKTYTIKQNSDSAAYTKDGNSGEITFNCTLTGDHVNAWLYPSKNFFGNFPRLLEAGNNGPYTWRLHDLNHDYGKISIKLIRGKEAELRCVQTAAK